MGGVQWRCLLIHIGSSLALAISVAYDAGRDREYRVLRMPRQTGSREHAREREKRQVRTRPESGLKLETLLYSPKELPVPGLLRLKAVWISIGGPSEPITAGQSLYGWLV